MNERQAQEDHGACGEITGNNEMVSGPSFPTT